jgi:hypothetical protein
MNTAQSFTAEGWQNFRKYNNFIKLCCVGAVGILTGLQGTHVI